MSITKLVVGLLVAAAIALGIYAVYRTSRSPDEVFKGNAFVSDFKFNGLSTTIENNGYIYAENINTHERWWVTSITIPDSSQPVSLPEDSSLVTATLGTVLNWLSKRTNADTTTNLEMSNTVTVKLRLKDAILTKTPILAAAGAVTAATDQIGKKLQQILKLSDYKFFIILESIKVKSLDYQFEKSVADNVRFKAAIKRVAEVNPSVKYNENERNTLSFQDDAYRVVLYKPFPLHIRSSLTGNYEITIQ
jgi:hypothetical protein